MIELLQNLLKIKSISPNDMGCFDLIEKELKELGFNCERINYLNVENLYATFGNSGKLFCFLGHTDVVPTGPETIFDESKVDILFNKIKEIRNRAVA